MIPGFPRTLRRNETVGFTVKHKKNSGMIVHSFTYTGDLAK